MKSQAAFTTLLEAGYKASVADLAMCRALTRGGYELPRHWIRYHPGSGDYYIGESATLATPPGFSSAQAREAAPDEVLADVRAEAGRAHAEHGADSMFSLSHTHEDRLAILAEEAGEVSGAATEWAMDLLARNGLLAEQVSSVARVLNDGRSSHKPRADHLYEELIQSAAMAVTWAARVRKLIEEAKG